MSRPRHLLLVSAVAMMLPASVASAQPFPPMPAWWPSPFIVWGSSPSPADPARPAPRVPLPAPSVETEWPREWSHMEQDVFALTNQRRMQGAVCGGQTYMPAAPLAADPVLRTAAREHSRDMGARDYFEHVSPDGRTPITRMRAAGWAGKLGGENIYGGQNNGAPLTAAEVVQGWMESPGHCSNIMNPRYTTLGVGFAAGPGSRLGNYWTQDFGG